MSDKHEWLEEGDGFTDVTLKTGVTIDGTKVMKLRMREPEVGDQLASDNAKGGDAAKEIALFANLCEVTPDDIKRLKLRDHKRLQVAFMGFID